MPRGQEVQKKGTGQQLKVTKLVALFTTKYLATVMQRAC